MKLILLIFIFAVTFGFVQNSQAQTKSKSKEKSRAPSRSDIEFMFGKAVACPPAVTDCFDSSGKKVECPKMDEYICFQNKRKMLIHVEFNSSGFVKRIAVSNNTQFYAAVEAAKEIIMLSGRGKFLKKEQKGSEFACASEFSEEYAYLTMYYSSQNCMSSMPGSVTIIWKE